MSLSTVACKIDLRKVAIYNEKKYLDVVIYPFSFFSVFLVSERD